MEELENRRKENEELLEEINSEVVSDEFETELNEISKNLRIPDYFGDKYTKFNVYFWFTFKNKEFVFKIKSDSFNINGQYTYELIENIVKIINKKNIVINHKNIKYIVSLKDYHEVKEEDEDELENKRDFYIKNYELKHCNKRDYTPKFDKESFPSQFLLNNINSKKISFIIKNPFNIMFREKTESNKEEGNNKYENYYDEE